MQSLPAPRPARKPVFKVAFLTVCAALLSFFVPATLHASPITYDLTLVPYAGFSIGGTGTLTIEGAPVSSGVSIYSAALGNLDDLSFTLAGQTFTPPGDGTTTVEFQNGSLWDITFSQELGKGTSNRYALHTTSNYAFYYNNELSLSAGSFATQVFAASPVPEPASLLLLTTGLFGGAALLYRRMAPQQIS